MPRALIQTIMSDCGVCYGQTLTTKEVHQENTAWNQIGEAYNHNPPGYNVTGHLSIEHTVEQWSPKLENFPVPLPDIPRRWNVHGPQAKKHSERPIPESSHFNVALVFTGREIQPKSVTQAHTSLQPLTADISRVGESPAPQGFVFQSEDCV